MVIHDGLFYFLLFICNALHLIGNTHYPIERDRKTIQ